MINNYSLEFCFKGDREYVHGTDIYNKIVNILNTQINKNFDLSFHGIAKYNMYISDIKPDNEKTLKFAFRYINNEKVKKTLYGIENTYKIECRYKYHENKIYDLSTLNLEAEKVELLVNSTFSFIENCVALNKYLLESLFPNANGRWYFTRIQLNYVKFKDIYPLELKLKANFNFKLTKTEIFIANISVGYIYFSLV